MEDRRHADAAAQSPDEVTAPTGEAPHAVTQCERCEQWDNHPKIHYGAATMHFDCMTAKERREVLGDGSVHSVTAAATRAPFEGVDRGLRGDKLRAHITKTHARELPKAEAARAAATELAATAEQEG